ncbi:MAG: diguanylate cyclase [Deltaproteobacteria bacterium]|nr:diguanylate cyclase [Deltaproteobacteria bacterium]
MEAVRSLLVIAGPAGWIPDSGRSGGAYDLAVLRVESLAEAEAIAGGRSWDVVAFQAERLRSAGTLEALDVLRRVAPEATFLAVTSRPDIQEAVDYLKQGVYEYLEEPLAPEAFLQSLAEAIENRDAFREILSLNQTLESQKRHLEEEKRELERRNSELEAISRMARAVSSTLDLQEILDQLAGRLRETFAYERIVIGLLDPKTSCEEARVGVGIPDEARDATLRSMRWPLRDAKRHPWLNTVLREGAVLRVDDPSTDPQTRSTPLADVHRGPFAKIPMVARGQIVGSITVDNPLSRRPVAEDEMDVLRIFADTAAMAVENARLYQTMRDLSVRDELTGLFNRRHFLQQIEAECNHSERHASPLALLMLDVDHFKLFNDGNDHLMGDEALRKVAALFLRNTRGIDTVARYGGEEFVIILPRTTKRNAHVVAEKLRRSVERATFEGEEALPGATLTVSVGIAGYPDDAQGTRELVERADWALYQAKAEGRNRVRTWEAPLEAQTG